MNPGWIGRCFPMLIPTELCCWIDKEMETPSPSPPAAWKGMEVPLTGAENSSVLMMQMPLMDTHAEHGNANPKKNESPRDRPHSLLSGIPIEHPLNFSAR